MERVLVRLHPSESVASLGIPVVGYVAAGFPSPAQDYLEDKIDLNQELIRNPAATFLARVSGISMSGDMEEGDLLVIDRSLPVRHDAIALCFLNGEFTVKRIHQKKDRVFLMPTNKLFPVIEVEEGGELMIWGIVTYIIKNARHT
ncbi:LexA family transcriptional regulator [Cesiribacter sp. SM1]|uniref:LexA family protein n=1 Tax=Cesiribacter sp. SM1 TaxID=2861196 RepID=UPI001CD561ED|nr:translesion error-prone DNA polymerase V autoproteolytic subunit [Cesiribacter sp. SM1]